MSNNTFVIGEQTQNALVEAINLWLEYNAGRERLNLGKPDTARLLQGVKLAFLRSDIESDRSAS